MIRHTNSAGGLLVFFNFYQLVLVFAAAFFIGAVFFHTTLAAFPGIVVGYLAIYQLAHAIMQVQGGSGRSTQVKKRQYEHQQFFHDAPTKVTLFCRSTL